MCIYPGLNGTWEHSVSYALLFNTMPCYNMMTQPPYDYLVITLSLINFGCQILFGKLRSCTLSKINSLKQQISILTEHFQ